jgi:hypothetical protein
VNIQDRFGNQTNKTYGVIALDATPPTVAITFEGKPVKDDTVSSMVWKICALH